MSKRRVRRPPPQNLRDLPLRTLTIESLDSEGRGVAREEGKVVFVERALTGETVEARMNDAEFLLAQLKILHAALAAASAARQSASAWARAAAAVSALTL